MAYWNFKDLTRRTTSDTILRDKAFNVAKNQKYHGYQMGLASRGLVFINFLIKRLQVEQFKMKSCFIKELAEQLHKPIIRKF